MRLELVFFVSGIFVLQLNRLLYVCHTPPSSRVKRVFDVMNPICSEIDFNHIKSRGYIG